MSVECDRMFVTSRWIYGADSRRDPKTENKDYHPPILFHHDPTTGEAYFSDEAGRLLDPETIPQYVRDSVEKDPVHTAPQFAPANIRPYQLDPVTGQEFQKGQRIHQDVLQGVPLLNEARSSDIIARQNQELLQTNKVLMERLEALEQSQAKPKGKKSPKPKYKGAAK